MPRKRNTADQIITKLRQAEVEVARGQPIGEVCRKLGTGGSFLGALPEVVPPAVYHDQEGAAASNFNSQRDIRFVPLFLFQFPSFLGTKLGLFPLFPFPLVFTSSFITHIWFLLD